VFEGEPYCPDCERFTLADLGELVDADPDVRRERAAWRRWCTEKEDQS